MKRLLCSILILGTIVGLCFWGLYGVKQAKEDLLRDVTAAQSLLEEKQMDALHERLYTMHQKWETYEPRFALYLDHEPLEAITEALMRLEQRSAEENPAELALGLAELQFHLEHLYEKEVPTPSNVF